jgi:starch synthase
LDKFLRTRIDSISGILNGLDDKYWDPQNDEFLAACFNHANLKKRAENKPELQSSFDLEPDMKRPLLAVVSRLDYQKGIDLVPEALSILMSSPAFSGNPWQMIILGAGDRELEALVRKFGTDFPNRVRVAIRFDAALSHRVYAGADMLLIPSRYEPCGIVQMIAMRYGCVPVASATGGLGDTIRDYYQTPDSTGFLFQHPSPDALADAIGRSLLVYNDQRRWKGLQRRGMQRDFSWTRSARQYIELYLSLLR